jgi:hypothetical protein
MGVPGLLRLLEEAGLLKDMSWDDFEAAGVKALAVDMSAVIHASLSSHVDLLNGVTEATLFQFLVRVGEDILHILRYVQRVHFVFDGRRLDDKRVNEIRAAAVQKALASLRETTDENDARKWQRQAIHGLATPIAPYVRLMLDYMQRQIAFNDRILVDVALYEADGRIAGLRHQGRIDAAFTVDSDLIVAGVDTVIFTQSVKTGSRRQGHTWRKGFSRVFNSGSADKGTKTSDHQFAGLYQRHKNLAITLLAYFAGNDYVKIKGVGIKRVIGAMLAVEQNNRPMTVHSVALHLAPIAKLSVEELVEKATVAALYFHCQPVLSGDSPGTLQPRVFLPPASLFPPEVDFPARWADHYFRGWAGSDLLAWRAGKYDVRASSPTLCQDSLNMEMKRVAEVVGETLLVEHGILRSASPPLGCRDWLLTRSYAADGDAATLAARQAVKLESFAHRAGGFERPQQNRAKLDKDELQFHKSRLHPAMEAATAYPPLSGAYRLHEKLIFDYFHRDGADTERASEAVHLGEGRITDVKIYKLLSPEGAAVEEVYIFGKARASQKRQEYDVAASLCVVGLNVISILWAVCMLPKNATLNSAGKVVDKQHNKLCLNRDLCVHGRLLLAEIRIMGLTEGSTDGRRLWGRKEGRVEGTITCYDLLQHVGVYRTRNAGASAQPVIVTGGSAAIAKAASATAATAAAPAVETATAPTATAPTATAPTATAPTATAPTATVASAIATAIPRATTAASSATVQDKQSASGVDRKELEHGMKEVAVAIAEAGSKDSSRSCVYLELYK